MPRGTVGIGIGGRAAAGCSAGSGVAKLFGAAVRAEAGLKGPAGRVAELFDAAADRAKPKLRARFGELDADDFGEVPMLQKRLHRDLV